MNLDTCLQKLKENALKYIARIKEDSPFSRSLEVAERKHSVKLQNFCVDRYFYHHLEDKLKIGAEIRRLFMGCSYCIHVSKIFKCTTCTDDCGCYTLSFENEYQVAKALEMNGTEYQSKKVVHQRCFRFL